MASLNELPQAVSGGVEFPRVGVFLDVDNLYLTSRHGPSGPVRLRYEALLSLARGLGRPVLTAAYLSLAPDDQCSMSLPIALKHVGFSRVVPMRRRRLVAGRQKSSCDIVMAMEAWGAVIRREVDVLMLGTGDGDFVPLVERVIELGVPVHVVGGASAAAPELLVAATSFTNAREVPDFLRPADLPSQSSEPAAALPRQIEGALVAQHAA